MNIGWKEAVLVTLIILLSCLTVFFSTRYYRNELILLLLTNFVRSSKN